MALKDWVRAKLASKMEVSPTGEELLVLRPWDTPPSDPELAKDPNNWGGTREIVSLEMLCALFEDNLIQRLPAQAIKATTNIPHAILVACDTFVDPADNQTKQRGYKKYFDQWKAEGLVQ